MNQFYREAAQPYRVIDHSNNFNSGSQIRVMDGRTSQFSRVSNIQVGQTQYVPKIIESGYIIGPPVAYTQQPFLPNNYIPYSSNHTNPLILQGSHVHRDYSPVHSRVKAISNVGFSPTNVRFVNSQSKIIPSAPQIVYNSPPVSHIIKQQTVPKTQYQHCVAECKNWQTKYNELYLKYMNISSQFNSDQIYLLKQQNNRLRSRIRQLQRHESSGQNSKDLRQLIERYKQSTLKECHLLLDRYKLQSKIVSSKHGQR